MPGIVDASEQKVDFSILIIAICWKKGYLTKKVRQPLAIVMCDVMVAFNTS